VPKINELGAHACAHNPKVAGSNPAPATNAIIKLRGIAATNFGFVWVQFTESYPEPPWPLARRFLFYPVQPFPCKRPSW